MKTREKGINVEKEKLEIIKWVTTIKDESSIAKLKMLKDKVKSSDWWDEITSEEKAAIEKGIEDSRAGRVKPHKEAKKLYEKWL